MASKSNGVGGKRPRKKTRKGSRESQAAVLLRLLDESGVTLFHDQDGVSYVAMTTLTFAARGDDLSGNHLVGEDVHRVSGQQFASLMTRLYYEETGRGPNTTALAEVRAAATARARYDGSCREVHTRLARTDEAVYLDLADSLRRVVKVTAHGWELIAQAPMAFRRPRGVRALPEPVAGGHLEELRALVNVPSDQDWTLLQGWLVAGLRGRGPYPALAVGGVQGSAKSTLSLMLRRMIDPAKVELRSPPREERDLAVAAANGWICAFDNLSGVSPWLSDALCRLATGGGFGTRALYTDDEEALFDLCRPVLLNGIEDLGHRGDFLERCITLTLPRISDAKRRPEQELWDAFEQRHPSLLGALLDRVSLALAHEAEVELDALPRMADAAVWVTAADGHTQFLDALTENLAEGALRSLEADPVAAAVFALLSEEGNFTGTATQLLADLNEVAEEGVTRRRGWPRTAHHLSGRLMRLAPAFRRQGVVFERARDGVRRMIRLYRAEG